MDLQTRKEKLDLLSKKLKKKKFWAILLALFTLSVNAFAWFVFSKYSEYQFTGSVSAWDVEMRDENQQLVNNIIVSVNMKPGMDTFTKTYEINNLGGVDAKFSYELQSLKILGRDINVYGIQDADDYLENFYPFSIDLSSDKSLIVAGDKATFSTVVNWDFEEANKFFALNNIYDYNSTFKYYKLSGTTYNEFEVSDTNYNANRDSLYLEKDDADTYFGMMCGDYQKSSGLDCIEMEILLKVEQNNS